MGITKIKMKVLNPQDESKFIHVNFLVDSGATHSFVPSEILKELGIKPNDERDFVLANGDLITRKLGVAVFKFKNRSALSQVVFAEDGDESLLGVVTLENMGLGLNPIQRVLVPLRFRA